jgi:cell division protein FtsQ
MFIDNNQVVQVKITERQPLARVFTLQGQSFYLDSNAVRLPLSDKITAKVPVFTGFPSDKPLLAKPDSSLLEGILAISKYIQKDSFWMAQLAQIDITPQAGFEMIPTVGDQIIVFGGADDLASKFNRLFVFYQKAWLQNGINTYEKIDVQYKNQVVAVKRGTTKAWGDSLNAMRIMNGAVPMNEIIANDSADAAKMKNAILSRMQADSTAKLLNEKPNKKTNSKQPSNNNLTIKPLTKGNNHHLKNQQPKNQSNQGNNKQPKALMDQKKLIPGENEKVKQ